MKPKIVFLCVISTNFRNKIPNYSCIRLEKNTLSFFCAWYVRVWRDVWVQKVWSGVYIVKIWIILWSHDLLGPPSSFLLFLFDVTRDDSSTDVHFKEELHFPIPVFRINSTRLWGIIIMTEVESGRSLIWMVIGVDSLAPTLYHIPYVARQKALESWTESWTKIFDYWLFDY